MPKLSTAGAWGQRNYWWLMLIGGIGLGLCAATWYLFEIARAVRLMVDRLGVLAEDPTSKAEDFRNIATGIAVLLAALAAAATLIFQLVRVWITERTTRTAEQNLITTQINKAVEGLGAEKTVKVRERRITFTFEGAQHEIQTEKIDAYTAELPEGATDIAPHEVKSEERTLPNLEVRIGAIYALERISQDSLRDHVQIMEILTAYIRENAPATGAQSFPDAYPEHPDKVTSKNERQERREMLGARLRSLEAWAYGLKPRTDIQAAITVIGRRRPDQMATERADTRKDKDGYRIDLRSTNLQGIDAANLNLDRSLLQEARMEGADLRNARMEGAVLWEARMEGADLRNARMEGAVLIEARMEGADLREARMEGADLSGARMEGADLSGARIEGANLRVARMEGADLWQVRMEGANLSGARMEGAVLRLARMEGAVLRLARMEGADLSGARMEGAVLIEARMEGADLWQVRMEGRTSEM